MVTEPGTGAEPRAAARDPQVRATMAALVETMVAAAGSNRRLGELSGVSEATVRNFRAGQFPSSSTAKADQLDRWAHTAMPDHPGVGEPGSLGRLLATWQGVAHGAAAPVADASPRSGRSARSARSGGSGRSGRRVRVVRTVALGAAVVGGLSALVALGLDLLDDGSEPSGVPGVRVQRELVLDEDNFCRWRFAADPVPLVSVDPLVLRSDARCTYPGDPDPVIDTGPVVFDAPDNDTAAAVGRIRPGNTFLVDCWVRSSDVVADGRPEPNRSPLWVRVQEPAGYLPVVNIGGGYDADQLTALGVPECPAP